jgi:hypothetical protein
MKRAKRPEVEWHPLREWVGRLVLSVHYLMTVRLRYGHYSWTLEMPPRIARCGRCRTLAAAKRACERAARQLERERLRGLAKL